MERETARTVRDRALYSVSPHDADAVAQYCYYDDCNKEVFNHMILSTRQINAVVCAACAAREPAGAGQGPRTVRRRFAVADLAARLAAFEHHYFGPPATRSWADSTGCAPDAASQA